MNWNRLVLPVLAALLLVPHGSTAAPKKTFVMVPKGVHPYYEPCYEGFKAAAKKFDVTVEQRISAKGERVTVSMAVVKVKVGDEVLISAAEGNGPVNALDLALRKDLGKYQSYINGLELSDYRVRILNGGSEAVTRVLIESSDETADHWTTVGVSSNIIDASFQALMDSIVYKLVRSGAPA